MKEGKPVARIGREWFPTFQGPVGLSIVAELPLASLNRTTAKRTNGDETDVWVCATVGYRKTNGKWMITHEHVSVPFYIDGSYRAAVDLKPEPTLNE